MMATSVHRPGRGSTLLHPNETPDLTHHRLVYFQRGPRSVCKGKRNLAEMTKDDLHDEWVYRFHERLGLLIDGTREATPEEKDMARAEADEAVKILENNRLTRP